MNKLSGILNYGGPSLADFSTSSSTSSHPSTSHNTSSSSQHSPPPPSPLYHQQQLHLNPTLVPPSLYSDPRRPHPAHHSSRPEFTLDLGRVGQDGDGLPRLADRFVKGWIHRRPAVPSSRRSRRDEVLNVPPPSPTGFDDSAVLTSLGRGPEGSERAAVVGNELIRIVAFRSPSSLAPLPPPPHPIPLQFSLYNSSLPLSTPPSTPPNAAPYRPSTPSSSSSSSRRLSAGTTGKSGGKSRRGASEYDGGESVTLGVGPGGFELEEVGTLRGLRDATGGSGVMETRWGTGPLSNKIFVSSRKGSVFVWDVNHPGKIQSNILVDSTRRPISAMRLAPAGFDTGEMLVTGGHDMIVRVFDLRTSRTTPQTTHTLTSNSIINSLAICPTNPQQVVLGLDNGSLGWIDWRKGNRMTNRKFSAHGDAVMSVDWKESLDERGEGRAAGGWIASGGLDKKVHIWNNSSASKTLHRTLRTSVPVSKISWRPGHDTELAVSPHSSKTSSGPLVDAVEAESQIQIWDVRRGYVPKYLLEGGEGPVAEIAWNDHSSLWSAYKNGLVAQLDVRLHSRPLDDVPRSTVCWAPAGHLAFTLNQWTEGEMPFDDYKPDVAPQLSMLGKAPKSIHDEPFNPNQSFAIYKVPGFDREVFGSLAQKYKLDGASPEKVCKMNARVAARHGLEREWNVWLQLLSILEDARLVASRPNLPFSTISKPIPDVDQVPSLNLPPPTTLSSPRGRTVPLVAEPRLMPRPRSTSQSPLARAILPERASSFGQNGKAGPSKSKLRESRIGSSGTVANYSTNEVVPSPSQVPVEYQRGLSLGLNLGSAFGLSSDSSVSTTDESDIEESSSSSFDQAPTPTTRQGTRSSFNTESRPSFGSPFGQPSSSVQLSRRLSPASHVPRPDFRSLAHPSLPSPESDSSGESNDSDIAPGPYGEEYGHTSIFSTVSTATNRTLALDSRRDSPIASPAAPRYDERKAPSATVVLSGSPSTSAPPPVYGSAAQGARKRSEDVASDAEAWRLEMGVRDEAVVWESLLELHELKLQLVRDWIQFYLAEGDCQMASMIFIVARDVLDFSLVQAERYVTAYVDLLMSLELYTSAATVRKYGSIPSLEIASQVNTTTHLSCAIHLTHEIAFAGDEDDPSLFSKIGRGTCEKSEQAAIVCCLCDLPVASGMLLGCQTCCHGGHASCLSLYFSLTTPLPAHPSSSSTATSTPGWSSLPSTAYLDSASNASDHSESRISRRASAEFGTTGAGGGRGRGEGEEGGEGVMWVQGCPAGCGHGCAVANYAFVSSAF